MSASPIVSASNTRESGSNVCTKRLVVVFPEPWVPLIQMIAFVQPGPVPFAFYFVAGDEIYCGTNPYAENIDSVSRSTGVCMTEPRAL